MGNLNIGYGRLSYNGKHYRAHRLAYWIYRGTIPKGKILDHLCNNTWCVNAWHLKATTDRVNVLRGNSPPAINARKTHCIRGHAFTGKNIVRDKKGKSCRTCRNAELRTRRKKLSKDPVYMENKRAYERERYKIRCQV